MSKEAAGHHKQAAEHHERAGRHHKEAAKHHESDYHEKAAHHAHLEHYPYSCTRLSGVLNQALASSEEMSVSASVIAVSRVSLDRALAERSSCLSLAQAFSMGFKSGE